MLPNFGYTVDRDFMEILPNVLDFLHVTDILDLMQTNKSVNALVDSRVGLSGRWRNLELNASEGDSEQDVMWSSFITLDDPEIVNTVLFSSNRYSDCEKLVLNNIGCLREFVGRKFFKKLLEKVIELKLNRFGFDFGFVAEQLTTLRLGIDSDLIGDNLKNLPELRLPQLRSLEILGFPIENSDPTSPLNSWLLTVLASTKIRRLRLNCIVRDPHERTEISAPSTRTWDSSELSFLEISYMKNFKKSRFYGEKISEFSDMLLSTTSSSGGFPNLHTVVVGHPTTRRMIQSLSQCSQLMHAVFNCFTIDDLSDFGKFFENTVRNLQILVVKIPGQSRFHFDSFLHMMMLAANGNPVLPPLMRFELEVVMDDETGVIKPPYHTVKGATALRCRYPDNMYFRRSKYGIAMSSYRPLCTEIPGPLTISSPMELFAEEVVRGMFSDSTTSDAEMYTEWNNLGQRMRSLFVEIFDEYVEREMRHGATTYSDLMRMLNDSSSREGSSKNGDKSVVCDVAATMANIRE